MTWRNRRSIAVAGIAIMLAFGALCAAGAAPAVAASTGAATVVPEVTGSPGFTAVTPARVLDTRLSPVHTLAAGGTIAVKVTGVAGVPATGVSAVALNVTGLARTRSTYLTVYPTGTSRPLASNLDVVPGVPQANAVFAQVGSDGTVTVSNSSGVTDVVVDLNGYFATSSSYVGQSPQRLVDTRVGGGAAVGANRTLTVSAAGHAGVPASGISSVVVNLTGISTKAATYLSALAPGATRPSSSNLNLVPGQTSAVLVIAQLSATGQLSVYNSGGPTHVVIDVLGWFTSTSDYTPIAPFRLIDTRGSFPHGVPYGGSIPVKAPGFTSVPYDAGAVVVSVTAIKPTTAGYLTVHPSGTPVGATSSLNVAAGATTPNLVVAQLSPQGTFEVYNHAKGADMVVDVVGWLATNQTVVFAPTFGYHAQSGEPFTADLTATSGRPPYIWSVGSKPLPSGLGLSPDGHIFGTPTTAGTTTAQLMATDATGETATAPVDFTVHAFTERSTWEWGLAFPVDLQPAFTPQEIPVSTPVTGLPPAAQLAVNTLGAYLLTEDGHVWSWGNDVYGGTGHGSYDNASEPPAVVAGLTDVTSVVTTGIGVLALKSDGTVWTWGQAPGPWSLNHGPTVPVQVQGLPAIASLASGGSTAYALGRDGTAWAWGSGGSGQLGNGSTLGLATAPMQVHVPTGVTFTAITGGGAGAYARASDGSVYAWGTGAVNSGAATTATTTPILVPGLSGITSISANGGDGYALTADGTLWAWGDDRYGELGDATLTTRNSPAPVAGLPPIVQVGAGAIYAVALDHDGQAWTWGINVGPQLGHHPSNQTWSTPAVATGPRLSAIATQDSTNTVLGIGMP